MSPTVFKEKGYRFFFFSREEPRMHVHVQSGNGEAKFWLEPEIELARNFGMTFVQVAEMKQIIEERKNELHAAWKKFFGD